MLQKDFYLYEYMIGKNHWNIVIWKIRFLLLLNMEDIIDVYYALAIKVYKDFEIKNLGEYHDLYVIYKRDVIPSWCIWELYEYMS